MLRALKQYAESKQSEDHELVNEPSNPFDGSTSDVDHSALVKKASIVWRGTAEEYRALLVIREAELVLAHTQLGRGKIQDWYINNNIAELEIQISDLQKWLTDTTGGGKE